MRLKTATSIVAMAAFFAGPALAADIHQAQAADVYNGYQESQEKMTNWSGFYIGVQGGYGVDTGELTVQEYRKVQGKDGTLAREGFIDSLAGQGFIGGAQIGADVAQGRWVYGLRGEYNFHDQDFDAGASIEPFLDGDLNVSSDQSWSAIGRIGYIASRDTLVYGLVGYTQKSFDLSFDDGKTRSSKSFNSSETLDGLVLGGGVELAKAGGWFVGLEGTYTIYEDAVWLDDRNADGNGVLVEADQDEFRSMLRIRKQLGSF